MSSLTTYDGPSSFFGEVNAETGGAETGATDVWKSGLCSPIKNSISLRLKFDIVHYHAWLISSALDDFNSRASPSNCLMSTTCLLRTSLVLHLLTASSAPSTFSEFLSYFHLLELNLYHLSSSNYFHTFTF